MYERKKRLLYIFIPQVKFLPERDFQIWSWVWSNLKFINILNELIIKLIKILYINQIITHKISNASDFFVKIIFVKISSSNKFKQLNQKVHMLVIGIFLIKFKFTAELNVRDSFE